MSEQTAEPKKDEIPPKAPGVRDFKILIEDSKLDPELKALLVAQHDENKEMRKTIQDMNTREQLSLRDKEVEIYLKALEDIRPDLREKYKDEKDLAMLKRAVEDAELLTSKYKNITLDDKGEPVKPPITYTSIDPITGKPRADEGTYI